MSVRHRLILRNLSIYATDSLGESHGEHHSYPALHLHDVIKVVTIQTADQSDLIYPERGELLCQENQAGLY